jgi:replicative DNA helicase Mcm
VIKPPLGIDLLRKVVAYARRNIDPKFEGENPVKAIKDFFIEWRKTAGGGGEPVPITPRQLHGLVRLAKANARLRLSNSVTVEDANRAIQLVKFSLHDVGIDPESGKYDIDIWLTGKSRSQREREVCVLGIIKELEGKYDGSAPVEEVERLAESKGVGLGFVREFIKREKDRGYLYESKPGMIARSVK